MAINIMDSMFFTTLSSYTVITVQKWQWIEYSFIKGTAALYEWAEEYL